MGMRCYLLLLLNQGRGGSRMVATRVEEYNHTSCTCAPAKSNQKERTTSALQIKSNRTNRGVEGEETTLCTCLVCWRVAAGAVADLDLPEMVGRSELRVGTR